MTPLTVRGFAPLEAEGTLRSFSYEVGELAETDVLVAVTHCGICFSDIDCIDNALGYHRFPFVPGHEVIGTVRAVGSRVRHLDVGQRVGVGPNARSCMVCEACRNGHEQLCPTGQLTLLPGLNGGFADHLVAGGEWTFPIPDGLDSAHAAPLMCAGVTTFAPLRRHVTSPMMRVGVIGIGGLGHLGLQFASRMGVEVTALAANTGPADDALYRALGAHHVVNITDAGAMRTEHGRYDVLLSTIHGKTTTVKHFVRLLRPNGKLVVVGAAMQPLDMPAAHLVLGQTSIIGSASGSRRDLVDMLEFATRHGIVPMIETIPMSDVNLGIAKVREGLPRFRVVLEV